MKIEKDCNAKFTFGKCFTHEKKHMKCTKECGDYTLPVADTTKKFEL